MQGPRRLVLAQVREALAPLVLVLVSLLSAAATFVDAARWVGLTAAAAAVASGAVVFRTQVMVPARIRAATSACVRVAARGHHVQHGSATQVASGVWVTAAHVIAAQVEDAGGPPPAQAIWLQLPQGPVEAQVVWRDSAADVAVLACAVPHPWTAGFDREAVLDAGSRVRLVAWNRFTHDLPALRVSQDYVVQAMSENGYALLAGPPAFAGMSGALAIDLTSGHVVGLAVRAAFAKEPDFRALPHSVPGVLLAPATLVPANRVL